MFYSHDFLTSSAVGLNTIWLAGTLNSATSNSVASLRRFNKRDVANTDLPRACEVIQHPPQPIALRLSGHLMHGAARVYTKQADYWMSDVNAAYTAFRRVILQKQTSSTTASGLVIVGSNETSAIDMPPPRKRHRDNITLPIRYGAEALDLRFQLDPFEWNDGAVPGNANNANDLHAFGFQGDSLNDSLSMFGSSMWSLEEQRRRESVLRDGSVDLGLGVLTTPGEHRYTADPAAIRRSSSILHQQSPLQQHDMPFMGGEDDMGLLNFGDSLAENGGGLILDLDGPNDLTFGQDDGNFDLLQDVGFEHGFDLGENGALIGEQADGAFQAAQPKKRRRVEPKLDKATVLDGETVRYHRGHYTQHMMGLRAQQMLQAAIKDCERRTRNLVCADDEGFTGASIVKELWRDNVDVQVARLADLGKGGNDSRRTAADGGAQAPVAPAVGFDLPFDVQAFDMMQPWDQQDAMAFDNQPAAGTLAPRGSQPEQFDESLEIGRCAGAGFVGDRTDMPWSRGRAGAMPGDDSGGIDAFLDDTMQHLSTRSITIETPTGLKRMGGQGSKAASASGAVDRSSDVGTPAQAAARRAGYLATPGGFAGEAASASQAFIEQDMADFLIYAKRTRANLSLHDDVTGERTMSTPSRGARAVPFLFSDVAPISDTKPEVAARAFYHILALSTAGLMSVEQREPYGEIQLELAA